MLISLEMPLFAIGHAYAFSPRDYVDPFAHYAARLPALYALRDATGGYDVLADSVGTLSGKGYGYQMFEPSEGVVHQGLGRVRRSRAGLRYTQGGKGEPQWRQSLSATLTRHPQPSTGCHSAALPTARATGRSARATAALARASSSGSTAT